MEEKDLKDYLATFKRLRVHFAGIAGSILALSLLIAYLWPPTFRASATILIEEQEIPTDLVRSTITTYAAQRLQMINQRVMTRANLERIIERFGLYPKERNKLTREELIEKMRTDLAFTPISAEVIDPRTGQPSKATIAFSVSYDGRNPDLVQRVANEVTSLYLEENLKSRTQKTAETSGFLQEEAKSMGEQVSLLEKRLAGFKEKHVHSLPEQQQLNMQFFQRTEDEIDGIDSSMRSLEERKFYLEGQLAQIEPDGPGIGVNGDRIQSPAARLKSLQTAYLSLVSRYSEKHPDVVKARQEMDALSRETGGVDSGMDEVKELNRLNAELAALSERYSDTHPDVLSLKKQISALQGKISRHSTLEASRKIAAAQPDNPAYIALKTQLDTTVQDMSAMVKRRQELKAKMGQYERRLSETPDIERQYLELVRDYENASAKYRELKAKEMEAEIAEQLEKKSKGEKFSIVEPPIMPEKPVKPNRIAIGFLGFVLSLASGGGYVFLREVMDKSVRGAKSVLALTGVPPLAMVPYVETEQAVAAQSRLRWYALAGLVAAMIIVLLLINWLWTPLDVIWFKGLRKIDQIVG